MKKFNYGKAEADLFDSGCPYSEEIYGYKSEKGVHNFMRENGLNPEKYYDGDNSTDSHNISGRGSGTEGCFLTTACVEARGLADDCLELKTLRAFRDNYMANLSNGQSEIEKYYEIAPEIVKSINSCANAKETWAFIYDKLIVPSVNMIKAGNFEKAYSHYKEYALMLGKRYL